MAPQVSALSPVDPNAVSEAEREEQSSWIIQKLAGSLQGRVVMATLQSLRASLGDSLLVEAATSAAWQGGNAIATDLLYSKAVKAIIPEHSKRLTTTAIKELTITIKFHHVSMDAALGFFRASLVVHKDSSLFSSIGDYLSIQKGWFSPVLQSSACRPVIPRNINPDVIFCHGPFLKADYLLALRLLADSATVINLGESTLPAPQDTSGKLATSAQLDETIKQGGPRRMLISVVGLAPHRLGLWSSSARPGESVVKYKLLNGCPAIVLPILPGSPLLAWNTLTLETLHGYIDELKEGEGVKEGARKINGVVSALSEYAGLCIDEKRIPVPSTPEGSSNINFDPHACLREAIALLVEGAVRSGLRESLKATKKEVDYTRAGIAMWRMP